ncbi:TNF receptor-associated factor 6-like [Stylophora pistillata]|uniref:TNF receptor-associated factor 6-like n=1 Tax=Stylophora pistillata TaxID=50429 RepID=UPI000C05668D|nr:TNF receptor-associated factor 6-like [Stylophora pistillata]
MVSCNYNDCKKEVKRKDLQQHMATECLLRKILCDYCNEAVLWNESKQHFENCIKYPQQCEKWREEGIERGKGLQSEVVKNVKELQSKIEELDNLITLLSNEGDHLKQRQETNEAQMRHETPLCGLEIDDRFGRQVDGMYTWKIENFRDCFQDAISGTSTAKYSPPFYTSKYGGYKLRMRINLNGVDDGVSKHMALFLHLREGDYDAILDWPLKREFRLSILDQSEDKEMHHDISKALVPKPHWRACQRPPENYFRGFGYKEFAPLEQILQPQYTKNDTLLVKFEMIG